MNKIFFILLLSPLFVKSQITNITGNTPKVVSVIPLSKMVASDSFLVKSNGYIVSVQRDSTGITGGAGGGISTVNVTSPVTGGGSTSTISIGLDTTTGSGGWHSYGFYNPLFVHLTGAETIAGAKTFSTTPIFSAEGNTGILFINSAGGQVATATSNFVYQSSNNRLVIAGATSASENLLLSHTYASATGDFIVMNDNAAGNIHIGDAASSGFAPYIRFVPDGTTQNNSFIQLNANNSGTTAAGVFRAENLNGSGTLSTQPLFDFQNFTTSVMKIEASGNVGIGLGGTAATTVLQLGGSFSKYGEGSITSASGAIANSETKILSSDIAMPANRLVAGTIIEIVLHGTCTSTAGGAGTVNVKYGTNGTTADGLLQSFTLGAAQTSGTTIPFTIRIIITIKTTGASATSDGGLDLINQGTTGISTTATEVIRGSATNINTTTASTFLTVSYQSGNASTASTFQDAVIKITYK